MVIAALLSVRPAAAQRFDCGSGDAGLDAVYLPAGGQRARVIREAVRRFCARARGRPRRYCDWAVPLVSESGCALEFYRPSAGHAARAVLGFHSERPEWAWHVTLGRAPGGWRVLRLFYDDLEHP